MPNTYTHSLVVSEDDIDINNHANNIKYIQWMQDCATAHSDSLGFSMEIYLKLGATWVVKSHQIDYMRSALLHDEVAVLTWISKVEKSRFTRDYEFRRKSDDKVLAKAQTQWVYFDINSKRPCRTVHDEVLKAFQISTL